MFVEQVWEKRLDKEWSGQVRVSRPTSEIERGVVSWSEILVTQNGDVEPSYGLNLNMKGLHDDQSFMD